MAKVRLAARGAVREVTLARADKRNALDAEMLAAHADEGLFAARAAGVRLA
jgi:enoyl-CoA hydratase/carnithine racemase